jgi:hypothetical protein
LFSSGLIAGGSLCGILVALLVGAQQSESFTAVGLDRFQTIGNAVPFLHEGTTGYVASALLFAALAVILGRAAQKKIM